MRKYTVNTFARWVDRGECVAYHQVLDARGHTVCECESLKRARQIAVLLNKSLASKEKS